MSKEQIFAEVKKIMLDVFDEDNLIIDENTTSDNIEDWDSITHITLMASIENKFAIKFTMNEIASMKNIGELVELIGKKYEKQD